ncbi:pyrroline-5-carboxylate reductase [Embleya scabrispora]|uniref:Pyrroline-5-carboxylate reductase n=1 Tax=Embleya scabrispora TaxID=159449 RepID=A0A1T3NIH6_9ACTN|nr:NAD(P)-binding domain-containing protein [Embleya scabrispora]OPC76515.1 pyrroline-5-carboxylate reductase [Embleya scabrispora]
MQRIGIIGVGEIGRAIVTGLHHEGRAASEVFLSPRGARPAAELSAQYEDVEVCADNQEVADRSEIVILAMRREHRHEALARVHVGSDKVVVNLRAGVGNDDLRQVLGTDAPLVRAIPLPTIRERRSVTVVYPSHPDVDAFFERLGGALPVADEDSFNVLSALTGTLTTHYAYLDTLTAWAADHGIAPNDADRYVRGLFQGVGRSLGDKNRSLDQLAADHETPNGNNERVRGTWFDAANAKALTNVLDGLLADLSPPKSR